MNRVVEELGDAGTDAVARAYRRWTDKLLDGSPEPREVRRRLSNLSTSTLEQLVYEGRLRGTMIGMILAMPDLDERVRLDRDDDARRASVEIAREVVVRPFSAAVRAFRSRVPITRGSWDRLTERERRRAFTVSGLARNDYVRQAQSVVTRALEEGWEQDEFRDELEDRFVKAGLDPLNPSHANTVFRTNISTAHADGRMGVFTQPAVLEAMPFWTWAAIDDKTARLTHLAMNGVSMRADDGAWQRIAPPCGFNCRCTITPSREGQAGEIVTGDDARVRALPDPGWTSSGFPFGLFEFDEAA